MDLERIKQNLRLRSGRLKKKNKKPSAAHTGQNGEATQPAPEESSPSKPSPEQTKRATRDEYSQTENRDAAEQQTADTIPVTNAEEHRLDHQSQASTPLSNRNLSLDRASANGGARHTTMVEPTSHQPAGSDGADFDLRPPPPRARMPSLETTAELLFSPGHLNAILHDQRSISRFTAFLSRYRPEYQPLILRYLETQKAIRAVEYANAVAEGATALNDSPTEGAPRSVPRAAAQLDKAFEEASSVAFSALVNEALPMFVTYNLMKVSSECLTNEVTGRQSVIMQSLVGGISEVFCITDPSQEDNPIIYASEEFYRYTGYGSEDVIGNNCRFLQGRKTSKDSIRRLKEATAKGEACCETILNYRRDGRPFINLLMIAPLHDDRGQVKYYIGAQVDVSGLVENGRGLDSFARYLGLRSNNRGRRATSEGDGRKERALTKLRELSEMFDLEEAAVVQTHIRANSSTRSDDSRSIGSSEKPRTLRRIFVSDSGSDASDESDHATDSPKDAWKLAQRGPRGLPSGKLPGIYDTYMLIRPAPSLRIVFISPKLQKLVKAIQSPFLSHVAAPPRTLLGLKESFMAGVPVSARINFMAQSGEARDGLKLGSGNRHEDNEYGKACWISATPLLGSDERPGVWMVVFVEKSKAPNAATMRTAKVESKAESELRRRTLPKDVANLTPTRDETPPTSKQRPSLQQRRQSSRKELPIKAKRLDDAEPPVPQTAVSRNDDSVTEVEDFHEAQAEISEEQPARHSAETLTEQPSTELPSEIINIKKSASGTQTPNIESPDRVVIQPSPDHEEERQQEFEQQHKQKDAQNDEPVAISRERSDTGYESTPKFRLDLDELRKFTPPPQIDSSMLAKTPRREDGARTEVDADGHEETDSDKLDETPVATRPHTRRSSGGGEGESEGEADLQQVQSPVPEYQSPLAAAQAVHEDEDRGDDEEENTSAFEDRPAMKRDMHGPSGFVDYLTHPGSGGRRVDAHEFGRALQEKGGRQSSEWSDNECLRTPYSVD